MYQFIMSMLPYAMAYAVPICVVALGGLYSEKSGVVNIALEGLMIVGAFTAALVASMLHKSMGAGAVWMGLLAAMVAGAIYSMLHAFASINLRANQVISGTALNILAPALTIFLARQLQGSGNINVAKGLSRFDVGFLAKIPIIGDMFFRQAYLTNYITMGLLVLTWLLLYKTAFGLRLRACGENPHALDAAGVNVYRMRYFGVMMSGALAALGGGILTMTVANQFNGSVSGLGFLALAALIFGQWRTLGIALATFFFGFLTTFANFSQVAPDINFIHPFYLKILPYLFTLIALVVFSRNSKAPKAVGEPFDKGKR